MPSEPEVVMTPAPKRLGKPVPHHGGHEIEPIATTVAGLEPETGGKQRARNDARQRQGRHTSAHHRRGESDHAPRHPAMGEEVAGKE
jgi:hypothetical protein